MFKADYLQESDLKAVEEYITSPQKRMYLVHPKIYMGIQSRGTGKSTVLQALRSMRIGNIDVPRSVNVFYGANYAGLQLRTIPGTLSGWMRFGLREGEDFVINQEPPKAWPKPWGYERPLSYKNTISTRWGSIFILGSNDRPGMVNSLSITGHVGIDEFRFVNYERMAQDLFPALRGNLSHWPNNPHTRSRTLTSDRPFAGESEWYEDYYKMMNLDQIYKIAQMSLLHESKAMEIFKLKQQIGSSELDSQQRAKARHELAVKYNELTKVAKHLAFVRGHWWDKPNKKWLKGSTFVDEASVFSNAHILTLDYIMENADERVMPKEIFKVSFLNLRPKRVENMFYGAWNPKRHIINGNWDYEALDRVGIVNPDKPEHSFKAEFLLDYSPALEVDVEFDFGDLVTCSISQTLHNNRRTIELYLATFEVKYPKTVNDVIDLINYFLEGHRNKTINLYLDPSGHYQKDKERSLVYSAKAQKKFEATGWKVIEHTPKGTLNALHDVKHTGINDVLREHEYILPQIRIIRETNKALINSIQLTPYRIEFDKHGNKVIAKDKRSEKDLALKDKRDGNTSDHSDHFDIKLMHKYGHLMTVTRQGFNSSFV